MSASERLIDVQIDRIVGPTHHFGGLGVGNVASQKNEGSTSSPKKAALQGLEKMRLVAGLGVPQLVLPPQPRPDYRFLQSIGYPGGFESLTAAAAQSPRILSAVMSSSAMWTANAATVAASVDGGHDSVVLTVANLTSSLHRAIEPSQTLADLWQSFPHSVLMLDPLPGGAMMRDEGAANHMRLGTELAEAGVHVFVYGDQEPSPQSFWPRQTRAACEAIARLHRLPPENTFFLKQHPQAIDAGAFHNDVVAASHHDLLLHHEYAFYEGDDELQRIANRYAEINGRQLKRIEVTHSQLPIDEAINTYLFNSQIVSPENTRRPVIICPAQVSENPIAKSIVDGWCGAEEIFDQAHFLDLRQSMSGGGGPACLRLRLPLTETELSEIPFPNRWSSKLDDSLRRVINENYPESVSFDDLSKPALVEQAARADQELRSLLHHR